MYRTRLLPYNHNAILFYAFVRIMQYCCITLPFYASVRISFYAHITLPFYAVVRIVFYAHITLPFYAARRILQLRNIQYNDTMIIQACCSVLKQYVDSVIHQALTRYPDRRTVVSCDTT